MPTRNRVIYDGQLKVACRSARTSIWTKRMPTVCRTARKQRAPTIFKTGNAPNQLFNFVDWPYNNHWQSCVNLWYCIEANICHDTQVDAMGRLTWQSHLPYATAQGRLLACRARRLELLLTAHVMSIYRWTVIGRLSFNNQGSRLSRGSEHVSTRSTVSCLK